VDELEIIVEFGEYMKYPVSAGGVIAAMTRDATTESTAAVATEVTA